METAVKEKKMRMSNLELFRIISMFLIVAHHYVVNSGLIAVITLSPKSASSIFLLLFGAWGKMGINCFVLITGYFMCKSSITFKKFLKLLLEIMFYRLVIYFIFLACGYIPFSFLDLVKQLIPIYKVSDNFTSCFLIFYLCIPFLNSLLHSIDERKHVKLLLLSLFLYVFLGTLPYFSVKMNYVSWFIVLYFIASYIRLYPKKIFDSVKTWLWLSIVTVLLSAVSVVACVYVGISPFYFVTDSNTFLAVATGLSLFMLFKNLKVKNSKVINLIASTTFGILLIHANSDAMRNWLWVDTLKNVSYFNSPWLYAHALISVVAVFAICSVIDAIRIRFVERPFFALYDKHSEKITAKYKTAEDKVCSKLHIGE